MEYVLIIALTFSLCFLADKAFTKLFRSKPQHRSGTAVRLSKKYASFGLVLTAVGIAAFFSGLKGSKVLLFGGIIVVLLGVSLIVYYMTFGVYYDEDTFLLCTFGRKGRVYRYAEITHQQLFTSAGGILIELYMTDGRSVGLQASMSGVYPFMDHAFSRWCVQTGRAPESCAFHKPEESCWFPIQEDT